MAEFFLPFSYEKHLFHFFSSSYWFTFFICKEEYIKHPGIILASILQFPLWNKTLYQLLYQIFLALKLVYLHHCYQQMKISTFLFTDNTLFFLLKKKKKKKHKPLTSFNQSKGKAELSCQFLRHLPVLIAGPRQFHVFWQWSL